MDIHELVMKFGNRFQGRIDKQKLDSALDYVSFNECALAFETVCDYLCEEDVNISQTEYEEIMALGSVFNIQWHTEQLSYLRGLVSHPNIQTTKS